MFLEPSSSAIDLEKPIYPSDYIEQQLYSGGFPHQIDKDKMKIITDTKYL